MKTFKYIITRLLAALVFIVFANILYKHTFWKKDISKHGDILENLWVVDENTDAIYFGESSNFYRTKQDTIKYRISGMLNDFIPELKISHVDNSGLHAGTYLAVINNIKKQKKLQLLIITMNLRSFGANWRYSLMENYLAKTEVMLSNFPCVLNKFSVSLKNYDFKTDQERMAEMKQAWQMEKLNISNFNYDNVNSWDSAMAMHEWIGKNPNLKEEHIPLACHYIKNFAFQIDTNNNERIHDFDEIMKIANQKNYKVVFNLLSENMAEAKKLVGDELVKLMEDNRDLLVERYEAQGAVVVDNLYAVPDSLFADRNWPTEHYAKEGKLIIAKNLKNAIQ